MKRFVKTIEGDVCEVISIDEYRGMVVTKQGDIPFGFIENGKEDGENPI